eukprot:Nitzschia sp. Nitz4//scaffold40_size135432//130078//133507//NITZ4_003273-RA/size135432-snap-gene-0.134-mRNA-1//-1//CDS//3329551306//4943//frame0
MMDASIPHTTTTPKMPPPPPRSEWMDPSGGIPDFMFCGSCAPTNEGGKQYLEEEEKLETYLQQKSNISPGALVLETKFLLHDAISNPSHILVLQSLLQPLPGVFKVQIHAQEQFVLLEHDASLSTENVLSALQSLGHSAKVESKSEADEAHPRWVRSHLFVQGICCATEVPAVRKIVKPLSGVSKLQINITTKVVTVQHDVGIISAQDIANRLGKEGFPSKVQRDGQVTAQVKRQALNVGRTTLHVNGVLVEHDVTQIQQILSSLPGTSRIGVNVSEAVVYIEHDFHILNSEKCAEALRPTFDCVVAIAAERAAGDAAASALDQIGRSKYVESTISVKGMSAMDVKTVEIAISRNFIRAQVRAVYPNAVAETVKVEHDPKLASSQDICSTMVGCGLSTAKVTVDGADLGLYLPLQEDYPSSRVSYGEEPSWMKIHASVWLSGIFWALSIVSYREGQEWFEYFGLASVLFGLPPICSKAFRTIRRWQFDANCMMVTAAVGALILGEYDEAASVAFLFAVSEFLEARATMRARRALGAIVSLRPDHANVVHPISKEIVVVPADRVPLGSTISVKAGDKIVADGVVIEGSSAVDESSLTGESHPSHKRVGDEVNGGTINVGTTQLLVRTTTTVEDSAVSRLIRLVEEAQSNRSPTEKMIDVFARSYTPSVMLMAVTMCTIPWIWGPEVGRYWTLNGLIIIVIACPCALTISTPVTYAAALAATAQRGIIVKGGANLEAMGSVDRIVFDKTGTLTKGKFSVLNLEVIGTAKSRHEMLELLALMQGRSSHPISACLVHAAKQEGVSIPQDIQLKNHTNLKGEGIMAVVNDTVLYVGNQRLFTRVGVFEKLSQEHQDMAKSWGSTGGTVGFIGTAEEGIFGMFCVMDAVREEAKAVIKGLRDAHIDTMICTGDSHDAAHAVAKEIGVPRGAVHSQLLPEDKLHFVGSLKRPQPTTLALCREKRYVLFCGDGVNDAPALAVADVGVSMGEGAAMAMEMSDITLMDSQLTKLSYSIKMGRRVLRTVKENIIISLVAKVIVVGLTFLGKMTLLLAIASDVGIMLAVTLNGMKLLPIASYDPKAWTELTNLHPKTRRLPGANGVVELSTFNHEYEEPPFQADAEIV